MFWTNNGNSNDIRRGEDLETIEADKKHSDRIW